MTETRKFSHRFNANGTVDSICRDCFVTIASEPRESELCLKERLHVCDPTLIEWYHRPVGKVNPAQRERRQDCP